MPSRVQKLELLPTSIDAVKSEVKKLSDSQASFERLCDGIQSDLEVLKSSFDALTLPSTTTSVNTEGMGRAERDSQLVILGTKLKSRETTADLLSILALIGCVLGLTFNTHDVHSIHRPKSKGNPIIVKFISTIIRDEWIAAKRKKRYLKASEVSPDWNEGLITITEPSLYSERKVFYEARKIVKEKGLAAVWMRRGITFVKQLPDSVPIRITSCTDLQKLSQL